MFFVLRRMIPLVFCDAKISVVPREGQRISIRRRGNPPWLPVIYIVRKAIYGGARKGRHGPTSGVQAKVDPYEIINNVFTYDIKGRHGPTRGCRLRPTPTKK